MNTLLTPEKRNNLRWWQVHAVSGLLLALFVGIHLTNHVLAGISPATHIAFMTAARTVYRHPVVETLLLMAVVLQTITGIRLVRSATHIGTNAWHRLQIGSGLYLALFLTIHVGAVMSGRLILRLDTNLYFGAAGLNHFPHQLFFIPYYSLGILSFFAHVAAIHQQKMNRTVATIPPLRQAQFVLAVGGILTVAILYGMTNRFRGLSVPAQYNVLTP